MREPSATITRRSAALICILSLCGCSQKASKDVRTPSAGSGSARVRYQPNVQIVEMHEAAMAVAGISKDGVTLVFNNIAPFSSLKAGDALVIKGVLARKIVAAQVLENKVFLFTRAPLITEVIKQGTIRVQAPIRFGAPQPAMAASNRRCCSLVPAAYAQSPEGQVLNNAEAKGSRDIYGNAARSIAGAVFKGWKTDYNAEPSDGKLDLHLKLTRDLGGFLAVITGDGYLSDFEFGSDIDIEEGEQSSFIDKLQTTCKKMNGLMNFKWEVATQGPGVRTGDDRIKLPAIAEIPLYQYLDGMPLFLEISSAMIIKPALTGGNEYSRGAFRITYDGYNHFQLNKGNMDDDGNVTGDIKFLESQDISTAPFGMVVAFAAPRIELSFGTTKIFTSEEDQLLRELQVDEGLKGYQERWKEVSEAAGSLDAAAGYLGKKVLGEEGYEKLKDIKLGESLENAIKSDATAFIEVVSSSGMSATGVTAILPCTRREIHLTVKAGVNAQLVGIKMGSSEKELYSKTFTRVEPPQANECKNIGGG